VQKSWWKKAVVYQIYPRSFYDANGDGIGDLAGIIQKLDYLRDLGIDVVWLSPIFASPNDDNGYDISDYYAIMPEFGTMADFDTLLAEAHRRGIKIVLDMVVNHTSDEHPWFIESKSSKSNPKRDWYIWRSGKDGREPNNWASCFSPSAWEFDEATGEYYLHIFSKKQPDLNWQNPQVREAIYSMMRFWLDKGVDGFRLDVLNWMVKAPGFPDAAPRADAPGPYIFDSRLIMNQPGIHELIHEMNQRVFSHYDIMTVGECHDLTAKTALAYVDSSRDELDMIFQFEQIQCYNNFLRFKQLVWQWYESFKDKAWNTVTLNNHDTPRQVSAFGNDGKYHRESAKLLALFNLTAPGTPFLYQGEEIGMSNVRFPSIDQHQDIETIHKYNLLLRKGVSAREALDQLAPLSRDNARTPVQWSAEENAGFSSTIPWLSVNPNYGAINVQQQQGDENSVLQFYRKAISLRKQYPDLIWGTYTPLSDDHPQLFAYMRDSGSSPFVIVLNFSDSEARFQFPAILRKKKRIVLLANYPQPTSEPHEQIPLRPWEAVLYCCE